MIFWTFWGKIKQVLSQMGIYFSVISIAGVLVTAWHTSIQPILLERGITPSGWLILPLLGIPLIVLAVVEWRKGTDGYFRSFEKMFYTKDSDMRKDIEALKKAVNETNKKLEELLKK